MRRLHRWVGFLASLFLIIISGTGVVLQVYRLGEAYSPRARSAPMPVPSADLARYLATTAAAVQRAAPGAGVAYLSLTMEAGRPVGEAFLAGGGGWQLSFDARTGESISGATPQRSGVDLKGLMLRLHRGDVLSLTGYWLSLIAGMALFTLGCTGLILYSTLYLTRLKLKRRSLLW